MAAISAAPRKALRSAGALAKKPGNTLEDFGAQLSFYGRCVGWAPKTVTRYKKEVFRLLAEVTLGSGGLALIAGTVGVILGLSFFTGTEVGLQGFLALDQIGAAAFAGFLSAYFNTRELAPLIAGLALAATVGCGFTAQLGAMRVSEEIDALEVMGVPSVPYLVTTRVIAALIAVVPLYFVGLLTSYLSTRIIVTLQFKQSTGTYDHYFHEFLLPKDVFYSLLKVVIFSIVIVLVHCYYGYFATGGPAGVGTAVGQAIRTSIVTVSIIDLLLSMAIFGATSAVRIAG
ncbi:MAG: phospholipid/cholesterol/gamma-HCH transport system permease protein [Frankiaceae bacterium]|nr:phospholipid/cholesterol/gamma-HCH transport system permease protein [Frankiaceae bacterium]